MGGGLSGIFSGRRGRLRKTGQITQRDSEPDDGFYQKGLAEAFEILTTDQYSGTVNIDLVHFTAATIAFAATTPGTITDSGNGLALFKTGDIIVISGSASNDGVYTVSTGNVAGTIRTTEATVFEAAGATVSIAKRDTHSNNCVRDLRTGLMWSRYSSAFNDKMGSTSNGKMPWTGQLYDIFQYVAAANAALLGGYTDWQVPNIVELYSLMNQEPPNGRPNSAAFPSWSGSLHVTSSTLPTDANYAMIIHVDVAWVKDTHKPTGENICALVRGG